MSVKTNANAAPSIGARPRLALIVDDSPLQRKILATSVKRWGYEIIQASSGSEALAICHQSRPDLVLSDWMMPGMNGLEFCNAFRKLPHEGYSYFILLTSKSEKEDVAQGLQSGADDFLTKPVDTNELHARIIAGERILHMQRELQDKNRLISETLDELQRVYSSVEQDLVEARDLQQSLVPERTREFDQGQLSLMLRSSGHVGGDLIGFFNAQPGHLGLFAIDVSGHGISSALMTARLAGYLSATAPLQNVALAHDDAGHFSMRPPHEVIQTINEMVLKEMETDHYFTMVLADLDLETGHMRIGQAGHPHPVIQRANGEVELVGDGGFPVGLIEGIKFSEFEVSLNPGDRLLVLSDGVTECPNEKGDMLEDTGLAEMMTNLHDVRGATFFDAMMWKLSDFAGNQDFPDDISGVLFEYWPPQSRID